jgi:hypothetical protein
MRGGWLFLGLLGCAHVVPATSLDPAADPALRVRLPASLVDIGEPLSASDPDYARAGLTDAVKADGLGGVSPGYAVRLDEDMTVYRLWNGPELLDARGNTNRLGQWWTADPPRGSVDAYRERYEVCVGWNQLRYVATCTLKAGSVVVIGPGQSVSSETCGAQEEAYPAQPRRWQVYVHKAWTRLGTELDCPPDTADYPANPLNLARPVRGYAPAE